MHLRSGSHNEAALEPKLEVFRSMDDGIKDALHQDAVVFESRGLDLITRRLSKMPY